MGRHRQHNTFLLLFLLLAGASDIVVVQSSLLGDLSDDLSSIDFAPTSTIPREKFLDDDIQEDQGLEEDVSEEEADLDDDNGKENGLGSDVEKNDNVEKEKGKGDENEKAGVNGDDEKEKKKKKKVDRKLIASFNDAKPPGVSTMHLVITHLNKAVIFGATNYGDPNFSLPEGQPCRFDQLTNAVDCTAHALEFDFLVAKLRPMMVETNPWCASGGVAADGTLVHTGGWWEGGNAVRYLGTCETCEWKEHVKDLAGKRWSATQQILPDGRFIVIGGHRQFSYEYVPPPGEPNKDTFSLPFLKETTDPDVEDNLYPFVHLSTDGNLFIFANNRSILFDYRKNQVVKEFPALQGGARNHPSPGMSAMIPLNLNRRFKSISEIKAEVIVCGGAPTFAAEKAGKGVRWIDKCARMDITSPNPRWMIEKMPKPRIKADLLNLPTGDLMFINGAARGSAGWELAREQVLEPWIYRPFVTTGDQRFEVLKPSTIPRLYHSTSAILPDGKILVAGSNTNYGHNFTGVIFPTDLRIEKLSPPYLDPSVSSHRPEITKTTENLHYDETFEVGFNLNETIEEPSHVRITMYAPPFTTHGYSMGQRLLILKTTDSVGDGGAGGLHKIVVTAPPSAVLAPPGYYMLFLVYRGVPSKAVWVHIE